MHFYKKDFQKELYKMYFYKIFSAYVVTGLFVIIPTFAISSQDKI